MAILNTKLYMKSFRIADSDAVDSRSAPAHL